MLNVLDDLETEAGDAVEDLGRAHQTHLAHAQVGQDLRPQAVGAQILRLFVLALRFGLATRYGEVFS